MGADVCTPEGSSGSGASSSCTDEWGNCSALVSGDTAAFEDQCNSEGNTLGSGCNGSYQYECPNAETQSAGEDNLTNIYWSSSYCAANPSIDLDGTCLQLSGQVGTGTPCV